MRKIIHIALITGCVLSWVSCGKQEKSTSGNAKGSEAPLHEEKAEGASSEEKFSKQMTQVLDPGLHWEVRVHAVQDLPSRLGSISVDRLYQFLSRKPASGEENWYLVCNEIMEVLRKRELAPGEYTSRTLDLIQSPSADPMIRDYAVQHLTQWISGVDPSRGETNQDLALQAFEALRKEVKIPANGALTMTGTALNALADAVINGSPVMREQKESVSQLAMDVVNAPHGSYSPVNQSSAIQVAARLKAPALAEACRGILADVTHSVDVRISAVAALGFVGDTTDAVQLQKLTQDDSCKFAARAALKRLGAEQ